MLVAQYAVFCLSHGHSQLPRFIWFMELYFNLHSRVLTVGIRTGMFFWLRAARGHLSYFFFFSRLLFFHLHPGRELSKAALGGEELLRALAMFGHRFSVVGVDTGLSVDLVKLMFQTVSTLIHGVVDSVLDR